MKRSTTARSSTGHRHSLRSQLDRSTCGQPAAPTGDRDGSVLLVVIGLLLLLMLVGFTFFTFASQEKISAEYYADSAKQFEAGLDLDAIWDVALEQLILGPDETNYQSVLWPGRYSLVPTAIGMFSNNAQGQVVPFDRLPFNGKGLNIASTTAGQPFVDNDFDGNPDAFSAQLLQFNISQMASLNGWTRAQILNPTPGMPPFPTIDPGYTYPDANSLFLAHVGVVNGTPVYTPSFHRPQYLRNTGVPVADWQTNTGTALNVMRPHPEHVNVADNSTRRFLSSTSVPAAPLIVGTRTIQPFPFAVDTANPNGVSGEQGVWSSNGTPAAAVENDVDNDGDGVAEGIWLDLNYPVQVLPDGRMYIPLISYTVIEADGLVNLNVHGNLAGMLDLNHPVGGGTTISRSNMGLSPSEVNPFWALYADPTSTTYLTPACAPGNPTAAMQQYRGFFGLSNTNPAQYVIDRIEAANMDMTFLMFGRAKYNVGMAGPNETFTINDLVEGRWGERNLLYSGASQPNPKSPGLFSRPGRTGFDDDGDQTAGSLDVEPRLGNLPIPSFGHPLDNGGGGTEFQTVNYGAGPERVSALVADPNPANLGAPTRFHQYNGYMGNVQYDAALNGSGYLSQNRNMSGMLDEGDEVVADRRYVKQYGSFDTLFPTDEMSGLHLSAADYSAILGQSRLRQLMPFNFELNQQAQAIRKQFTTDSYDRRQHSFSYCTYPTAAPRGAWEFNADWDADGIANDFPPRANPASLASGATQPFRLETASVIGSKLNNTNPNASLFNRQLRLNINRFLTTPNPFNGFSTSNPPIYRHLTPHPTTLNSAPIPGSPGGAAAPTVFSVSTPQEQEYWARVDRQKMARDIYVMLYMLGGTQDGVNYATTSNKDPDGPSLPMPRPLYTDWQLKEMAQFAVNYVDALDRDDVITVFEYDVDLSDGWGLDDNPYSIDASGDRFTVYGVEAQTLTLSEALCVRAPNINPPADNNRTPYNDGQNGDRTFTYVELRNAGPNAVNLANGSWRIRLQRSNSLTIPDYSVVPLRDGLNNTTTIAPNGQFIIGSVATATGASDTFVDGSGNTVHRGADFRVDIDDNGQFDRIIPAISDGPGPSATQSVPPGTNLDLVHDRDFNGTSFQLIRHAGQTLLTQQPPLTGTDVSGSSFRGEFGGFRPFGSNPGQPVAAAESLLFILERRVNPYRNPASVTDANQNADNPWVVVDVFQDTSGTIRPLARNFQIASGDSGPTILANNLGTLISTERASPLDRRNTAHRTITLGQKWVNSLGMQVNSNVAALGPNQVVWQPHFNRDFSSVVELFDVPLYGPDETTARLAYNGKVLPDVTYTFVPPQAASGLEYQANVAGAKFLQPLNKNPPAPSPYQGYHNNRWYRILELLEFPSRVNRQVELSIGTDLLRVPGKMNLNGIRHAEVLFSLLDDPNQFNLSLQDNFENLRVWWTNWIQARDGRDPYSGRILPGSAASRPFRDYSQVTAPLPVPPGTNVVASQERTLLRKLPYDSEDLNDNGSLVPGADYNGSSSVDFYGTGQRKLLEARTRNDLGNNYVDTRARNRLLAKVSNNSTTRSNVFIVYMTVGYFDAYQPNPGNPNIVMIGAEIDPTDRHKGFFMVDRTLLEDGYNASTGTFDFRKFVQYRKTIR